MLEKLRSRIKSAPAAAARRGRAVRKKLRSRIKPDNWWIWEKKHRWLIAVIALVLIGILDSYVTNFIIKIKESVTLTKWLTFIGSVTGLALLYQRTKNQDQQLEMQNRQIQIQTDKEIDDRFTAAVTLLGNDKESARTGAVYSLYQLAVKSDKYRSQATQILCSHIRSKTQEPEYQENHTKRPSNEIQTTIDLLFKHENELEGIYHKGFSGLPSPNLSYAYLAGADFKEAQCKHAIFGMARCQQANFRDAQCQGASFGMAQCQGADFGKAQCWYVNFNLAQCHGANFDFAQCQQADFRKTQCQGASFDTAECQGADFSSAQFQGADFSNARFQCAGFWQAQCQGTKFSDTNMKGAYSTEDFQPLSERIGKNTELSDVVFSGELEEQAIKAIENAKAFLPDYEHQKMQEIIDASKGKPVNAGIDASDEWLKQLGIITGISEDSELECIEEIQRIIRGD